MTTTEQLIAQLRERHDRGLAKYGVTVDRNDLTPEEWAQHALEELLDGAAYLMRLKDTMAEARARLKASNRMVAKPAWNEEPPRWMRELPKGTIGDVNDESLRAFAATVLDAPQDRIRELEAELVQIKASHRMAADAFDAARQDRDLALAKVARLEATLAASRQGHAKEPSTHPSFPNP